MKVLTLFSIALVVFAAAPVLACGGDGGDKDDTAAFTINVQTLCGGDKGDDAGDGQTAVCLCNKPSPEPEPACGGGDKGDSDVPAMLCGGTCGGGNDEDVEA